MPVSKQVVAEFVEIEPAVRSAEAARKKTLALAVQLEPVFPLQDVGTYFRSASAHGRAKRCIGG